MSPSGGEALTDAILDWRDPDPLERLNGVESDYYLSLPLPYPAKDGPFDTRTNCCWYAGSAAGCTTAF